MVGFLVNNNDSEKYKREFERNNYYGIPNFEEVLKVVEWESPYINDGDDSVMPFDYDDL